MRKVKLYIAQSLNGKIAKPDGSVDWLHEIPNPESSDYGYSEFYSKIGITIQGSNTYKLITDMDIEFPYKEKTNYVFTRNKDLVETEYVTFINENHIQFVRDLKEQEGEDIWLIGGGQINTMLLNENMIDEIYVFVMPIILSDGIELFELVPRETSLELFDSKTYSSGVVELKYKLNKN